MASKKKTQFEDIVDSGFGSSFDHDQQLGPPVQQFNQLTLQTPSCPFSKQDEDGDTLLHIALKNGEEVSACKLIEVMKNEDLELRNHDGMTPLLLAVTGEMISPLRLMIDRNIAVDCVDCKTRNNIVHIATERCYHDVIEAIFTGTEHLVRETCDSLAKLLQSDNEFGLAPLHIAVKKKDEKSCYLLKRIGAAVDAKDTLTGYTSLHHAVLTNDGSFVKNFIAICKPALDVPSYQGFTPYALADINKTEAVKQVLIEAGASQVHESFDDEDM